MNKMPIDFYVLGAFMKNIITSDLDSTSIVTIKNGGKTLRTIHFLKKPLKPDKMMCNVNKSIIFCLGTRHRKNVLSLAMP